MKNNIYKIAVISAFCIISLSLKAQAETSATPSPSPTATSSSLVEFKSPEPSPGEIKITIPINPSTSPTPSASLKPTPKPSVSPTATPIPSPSPTVDIKAPSLKDDIKMNDTPFLVERFKITDIAITGTDRKDSILMAMYIKVGDTVTPSQIKDDLRRVYGLGYFIDINAPREPYEDGYRLIIQVVENPLVAKVEISNEITVFKKEQIIEMFKEQLYKTANYTDINTTKEKIKSLYSELGYGLADVDFNLSADGVLKIYIKEGMIEDIKVVGLKETKLFVVARELTQKPGDLFNINIMREDLRRIINLNYFEKVNLDFSIGDKDPQKVILIVKLEEKITGGVNGGIGYNSRDGIVGMGTISKDNLFGRGQRLGLDLTIGGKSGYGSLDWYDPWMFPDRTSLGIGVYRTRTPQYFADFMEDRTGVRISSSRPLFGDPMTTPWRAGISLRTDRVSALKLNPAENESPYLPDLSVSGSADASDNIVGLGMSLSYDTRDIIFDPHNGWLGSVTVEPTMGDARYIKLSSSLSTYIPIFDKVTLAMGTRIGYINGLTPKYERYYSGGFNTIRGWSENGYLSGNSMMINQVELRFPIYEMLSGVAFFDFGQFWEDGIPMDADYKKDAEKLYEGMFRYGFGLGLRVNTPMGPIRLDYGFRDVSDLTLGSMHFSIGHKF